MALSKVEVKVGSGSWLPVTGTTSWSVDSVPLAVGKNIITARAIDASDNATETSVTVTYTPSDVETLVISIKSPTDGQVFIVGSGTSGENFSNIEVKEKYWKDIFKNKVTSYIFTNKSNPILFVNVTGNVSAEEINTAIEVLKNTSSLVKNPAPGIVYKNMNIWVGTSGFATPKNIKEAFIKFKVDNNWMSANSITSSDLILKKWNGNSWIDIETRVLSKDDTNTFFEGKTYAFSPFAIAGKMAEVKPTDKVLGSEIPHPPEVKVPGHDEKTSQPAETANITRVTSSRISTWSQILIVLIIYIILGAMYFLWLKN
jgi:PGF-pre-PGF domain-containing protein